MFLIMGYGIDVVASLCQQVHSTHTGHDCHDCTGFKSVLYCEQEYSDYIQPHPKRADRHIVVVPINLFTDDSSGNRSKKWNKFDCWTLMLAGLPKHENAKLHNIHFITCSNKVSVLDMAAPIVRDLIRLEEGSLEIFDSYLGKKVYVVAPVMIIQSDNPRASELLNHQGGSTNLYRRMCNVSHCYNLQVCSYCSSIYIG